ncbi:hypothetical protein G7Y89_g8605 [Cudoniella acicularis]|uniref:Metallo-beta-lactamase domain-containing protein n=1 Tax=Cudoniella acicularis TaxID=354080 RepID=A0A8H4RGA9_9HELO|nr:hypothetical protein G7Y89_g8605 [Cudoniella acicularis]
MIKQIECRGTPYEIGFTHGILAAPEIERCITFYATLFSKTSKCTWPQVQDTAKTFESQIKQKWPRFYQEMQGIADGSKHDILDIVAINVRTEIAFGLFSDGCTSLFWETSGRKFLGQNWDWYPEQKENLIGLTIFQESLPTIKIITEAGIIGKIGLNSAGVGVCFNAIRARGLSITRMPVHLGLRTVLESTSTTQAIEKLEAAGMASSAHMLIADCSGEAIGLEFTSSTFAKIKKDGKGRIVHSNHMLREHEGFVAPVWMEDSPVRIERMSYLTEEFEGKEVEWGNFSALFEDESGYPEAICRAREGKSEAATLFNIVIDLREKKAVVKIGRPRRVQKYLVPSTRNSFLHISTARNQLNQFTKMSITVQILQTGSVTIRPTAYTQPADRPVLLRRLRFLTDRTWMPSSLPIHTFLITHPEGPILFDTGMSPHCNDAGYFPFWAPTIKMMSQMHIKEDEGIVTLLHEKGVEPKDLKAVIVSHVHHDHSGGLEDLAKAPIFMSKEHWEAFKSPVKATIEGAAPSHWPKNFTPKFLDPSGEAIGPFEKSYPITSDGKIVAVDTPGHVPGHVSLVVFADETTYFLTGDATYDLSCLDKEVTDGVNDDPFTAVNTLKKIKEFARQRPLVVLPSHDNETIQRLEEKTVYAPTEL